MTFQKVDIGEWHIYNIHIGFYGLIGHKLGKDDNITLFIQW